MSWLDLFRYRRRSKPRRGLNTKDRFRPGAYFLSEARSGQTNLKAGLFPRFWSTAGDRIDQLQPDQFANVRMRLRKVFTPSQPVIDRRIFAGRKEILKALTRSIEELHRHVVLYSERGFGKTSILHVVTQAARDARYIVAYVSSGAGSNFDEVFRSVAAQIPMLYHSSVEATSPAAEQRKTIADTLPAGPISPRAASDALAKVVRTRVIVILDEFDRCESEEFRRNVAELIKNLSDRSARVLLVIAGVAGNLAELIAHIPSIQRNIIAVHLPHMRKEEIIQLITNGEDATGIRFDEPAAAGIVSVANGFPYLASLLCQHASLHALDASRLSVTKDDLLAAIADALEDLKGRVSAEAQAEIADLLRSGQINLLSDAAGVAMLSGGRFQPEHIVGANSSLDGIRQTSGLFENLARKRTLFERRPDTERGSYRFLEDGVALYLWLASWQERLREQENIATVGPRLNVRQNTPNEKSQPAA